MNFKEYQRFAMKFAEYEDSFYPFLGLSEEVGELNSYIAKFARGDDLVERYGDSEVILDLVRKEAGDVLWMLTAVCHEWGFELDDVANENLTKLQKRKTKGNIKGTGDER